MQFIEIIDFLIAPIYIYIFYLFVRKKAVTYRTNGLYKFYMTAFILHMAGAVLYALVVQYYYHYGDSFVFFMGSNFITDISKDELTLKYFFYGPEQLSKLYLSNQTGDAFVGNVMNNPGNLAVMKISAIISFITFNRYLIITLFFGLFSFAGLWRLFNTFNEILEYKAQKLLAFTVLYTPSIWFWGSGLIKDSICIGCVGFIFNILYTFFIKYKFSPQNLVLLILCSYLLIVIKSYIAGAIIAAIIIFSVHYFIKKKETLLKKLVYTILISLVSFLILNFTLQSYFNSLIEDSKATVDTFKNIYENFDAAGEAGSGFAGKNIDFTILGIILSSPGNIFTTLFRPFLWEIKNLMMVFSSLESFFALLVFLYLLFKTRLKFFSYIFSNPFILFSFVVIIILSLIIGFTTFNFGTMVRYRIPILPFFAFLLISIYVKYKEANIDN